MAPTTCSLFDSLLHKLHTSHQHQDQSPKLHFQHKPVPGMYLTDNSNRRFLVAIKANGTSHANEIFKPKVSHKSTEQFRPEFYEGSAWSSTTSLDKSSIIRSSTTSLKTKAATSAPSSKDSLATSSTRRRSPLNTISENKHDRKPSAIKKHARHFLPISWINSVASIVPTLKRSCVITGEDNCGGYRTLLEPLEIKYSYVLERWMFVAEIAARTSIKTICGVEKCLQLEHGECERRCAATVERECFVLDDGETWVITGHFRDGKIVRRAGKTMWNASFWYVSEMGEMCRVRPNAWCRKRKELFALWHREERTLIDEEELYGRVVEYVTGDFH